MMMLKNIAAAPERGVLYGVYTNRICYTNFKKEQAKGCEEELKLHLFDGDSGESIVKMSDIALENLLELHLFDDDCEYRFIRLSGGTAEWLISDSEWKLLSATGKYEGSQTRTFGQDAPETKPDRNLRVYKETVYVTPDNPDRSDGFTDKDKITVVNYIEYDENDMIRMVNYRYSTKCEEAGA